MAAPTETEIRAQVEALLQVGYLEDAVKAIPDAIKKGISASEADSIRRDLLSPSSLVSVAGVPTRLEDVVEAEVLERVDQLRDYRGANDFLSWAVRQRLITADKAAALGHQIEVARKAEELIDEAGGVLASEAMGRAIRQKVGHFPKWLIVLALVALLAGIVGAVIFAANDPSGGRFAANLGCVIGGAIFVIGPIVAIGGIVLTILGVVKGFRGK